MLGSWYFWTCLIFISIFILWVFYGGKDHVFVGLKPLCPDYVIKDNLEHLEPDVEVELNAIEDEIKMEEKIKDVLEAEAEAIEANPQTEFKQTQGYRSKSKGEAICKKCMETWFKAPFYNVRPTWLKNPKTNCNLELDLFNPDFRLAVEYNGIQHYEYPNKFSKSEEEFLAGIQKDRFKKEMCDKHGVYLIIVPYKIKNEEIPKYLKDLLPHHLRPLARDVIKLDDY